MGYRTKTMVVMVASELRCAEGSGETLPLATDSRQAQAVIRNVRDRSDQGSTRNKRTIECITKSPDIGLAINSAAA